MALEVETGTGSATAESYVSVAEADTYHAKFGNASWDGAAGAKEAALRRATRFLDNAYRLAFYGYKISPSQALEWPRYDVVDPSGYLFPSDALPKQLCAACCEAALRELTSPGSLQPDFARGGAILSQTVAAGPVSTSTTYRADAIAGTAYTVIDDLLSGLVGGLNVGRIRRG